MSKKTKQVKVMVVSRAVTVPSMDISRIYVTIVPRTIMAADVSTRCITGRVSTRAVRDRGGRVMTAGSTGSTPRDWAGGPSIRMSGKTEGVSDIRSGWIRKGVQHLLIHRICIALRGLRRPNMVLKSTKLRAATLVLSWKVRKF